MKNRTLLILSIVMLTITGCGSEKNGITESYDFDHTENIESTENAETAVSEETKSILVVHN